MTKDEKYIARCIQLASNGLCNASPNPMVGAVVVHNDLIIGEGYHVRCGEAHAEVNAIRSERQGIIKGINHLCQLGTMLTLWENPSLCRLNHQGRYS